MVAVINENNENIVAMQITGAEYPITISWEKTEPLLEAYLVIDGKMIEIESTGEATVPNDSTQILLKFGLKNNTETPKEYELQQNYPNPFNPTTTINYQLPVDSKVTLKVHNVLGQVVSVLIDEYQSVGYKSVMWNAKDLASGIYFYRLDAVSNDDPKNSFTEVKKIVLIK